MSAALTGLSCFISMWQNLRVTIALLADVTAGKP